MWTALSTTINREPARARRAACRSVPRLQPLEDRLAPATFAVTTRLDTLDPADGKLSLREAISRANATAEADTVTLPAGVYRIALDGDPHESNNLAGDFDILGGLTIRGAGAGTTVVDAQGLDRAFDVYGLTPGAFTVTLRGLTVRGGADQPFFGGGAILVGNAHLVVKDCVITDNRTALSGGAISNAYAPGTGDVTLVRTKVARNVAAGPGGGLYVAGDSNGQGSTLTVTGGTIRRNLSSSFGGGLYADTVTLTDSTVRGNFSRAEGGGISAGTATLTRVTVSGNSAFEGGGLRAGTVTLTDSTVSGNSAPGSGGGISAHTATLTNSTVSGNTAIQDGGGVLASSATLTASSATLINSTVSGNHSGRNGGGIRAFGPVSLTNATVTDNSAANAGGGVYHDPAGSGLFSVQNSIIAGNLVNFTGAGPDVGGAFNSLGHNLIGIGDGSTGFGAATSDIVGTAADPIDPMLGDLRNNGGKTLTHALKAGSPAIDRGNNTGAPRTDQRGLSRIKDGDGNGTRIVDIGALEK